MDSLVADLVEICFRQGIEWFVICPGSRSAPLTLALARHGRMRTLVIPDERAAAFTALGMALQSGKTVGLVCTSGTAVLNFAPAVAEAFFQQVPLLILTADRPPEWINQQDGQTLYQRNVYGANVKASVELPTDTSHPDARWHWVRSLNEALLQTQLAPQGPVHINVPLREPLYGNSAKANAAVRIMQVLAAEGRLTAESWRFFQECWEEAPKKLIVVAQHALDLPLLAQLKHIGEEWGVPVVGDIISNLHPLPEAILQAEILLTGQGEEALYPDLLLTFGKSLVSKSLKKFLRQSQPRWHFHIQPAGLPADTFQTLTHLLPVSPLYFLQTLFTDMDFMHFQGGEEAETHPEYAQLWKQAERKARRKLEQALAIKPFGEFGAMHILLENLPSPLQLHLSNSMPVRYANMLGLHDKTGIEVFANRGTSGIDGSTSTALGAARMTDKWVLLLTGDLAFFYDHNAFWQAALPANLRVVVLNNHGGGIFRLIDSGKEPEMEAFFETHNPLTAGLTAQQFGMGYTLCHTAAELQEALPAFFTPSDAPKILEIETDKEVNGAVYAYIKNQLSTEE